MLSFWACPKIGPRAVSIRAVIGDADDKFAVSGHARTRLAIISQPIKCMNSGRNFAPLRTSLRVRYGTVAPAPVRTGTSDGRAPGRFRALCTLPYRTIASLAAICSCRPRAAFTVCFSPWGTKSLEKKVMMLLPRGLFVRRFLSPLKIQKAIFKKRN